MPFDLAAPEPKLIERIEVPGYPGVEVDAFARVWVNGVEKAGWIANGYVFICCPGRKDVKRAWLVCTAFHGPRPGGIQGIKGTSGLVCRHRNDISTDDRPGNLTWGTQSQNLKDAFRNGKASNLGKLHPGAKLTEKDVLWIREQYATGIWTQQDLADLLEVKQETISSIILRRRWRHI